MRRLQLAYGTMPNALLGTTAGAVRETAGSPSGSPPGLVGSSPAPRPGLADPALLLAVGLFGSYALQGSSYDFLRAMFNPEPSDDSYGG